MPGESLNSCSFHQVDTTKALSSSNSKPSNINQIMPGCWTKLRFECYLYSQVKWIEVNTLMIAMKSTPQWVSVVSVSWDTPRRRAVWGGGGTRKRKWRRWGGKGVGGATVKIPCSAMRARKGKGIDGNLGNGRGTGARMGCCLLGSRIWALQFTPLRFGLCSPWSRPLGFDPTTAVDFDDVDEPQCSKLS